MISTLAVGYDGSDTAKKAVDAAAEMAQAFGAKVVLLSASKGSDAIPAGGESIELQWAHSNAARTAEMVDRATRDLRARGIECTSSVDEGDPADVLVRLAEECNADVLIVGNKHMNRRLLGSVPNTVTHKANCSVFVVKTT